MLFRSWDIYRILKLKKPKFVLLENVDRLLKSPASQRGRDFAIMLSCFASLGYSVEWRVVNSAEYGFPQRRKRVFIFGHLTDDVWQLEDQLKNGIMSKAFPIAEVEEFQRLEIPEDLIEATDNFCKGVKKSPFETAGVMQNYEVATAKIEEAYDGNLGCLEIGRASCRKECRSRWSPYH